ncbi:MAG TPA: MBL fold metallo-hydrolase [Burkholderiaceae bacterium]|nr:MBL fold metallo-hydrolase [Burkholderiaceae bacterium]
MAAEVQSFFDPATGSLTHLVHAGRGSASAIIDPVLDFDPVAARTSTRSVDHVLEFAQRHDLSVDWILETHAHADHLSSADYVRQETGARIAIGHRIVEVLEAFRGIYDWPADVTVGTCRFDRLVSEGEEFRIGQLRIRVLCVPGHTPASVAYAVDDCVFVGDLVLRPEIGSARCDFPGGDPRALYRSIRRIMALPPSTRLFLCHDYPEAGDEPRIVTTVEEQRQRNVHIRDGIGEEEFVALRHARDATLPPPRLIIPSIQCNVLGCRLPSPSANGRRYLNMPLDTF